MTWPPQAVPPQHSDPWGPPAPAQQVAPSTAPPPSAAELLAGGGTKGFSFDGSPPLRLGGKIVSVAVEQKRDFDTKQPMFWQDDPARPRWVLVVACATDLRETPEDDGVRAHYLEYKKAEAVKKELQKAGVAEPEVDGYLYLTFLAPAPPKGKAKEYGAEYTRPGQTPPPPMGAQSATPAGLGSPPPAAAPPAAETPGSVAMAAGAPMELAKALVNAGLTIDEARRLPSLASGWQSAPAEQILPYLRTAAPAATPAQPSYTSEPPF